MDRRSYNIFFDLHTVSGIVLSVLLYVIFFAGTFSFFRDEIVNWERNDHVEVKTELNLDINAALDSIGKNYDLSGRDIVFYRSYEEQRVGVDISESKDSLNKQEGKFFYLDTKIFKQFSYEDSYSLGEFLYRLHFFAQVPYPFGYYLSGFTALFLLFVLLTGLLVHWKKIISNFYQFRPWAKLKTVWTDAHTALGTIGLPFQVVYAITGAFFMINILLVAPSVFALYDGNTDKLYEDLGYEHPHYDYQRKKFAGTVNFNTYVELAREKWRDFHVTEVVISNYGDEGMHALVEGHLSYSTKFTAHGEMIFSASSNNVVYEKDPYQETSYLDGVKNSLYKLHFGDYGGYFVKAISFLMGLLSCFVIISGILIWLEARNKKDIPEKQKKFNRMVGHIYLAICLTMYPVTAFSFLVTKLLPPSFDPQRQTVIYSVYFLSWLFLSIFFTLKKNNYITNKYTLLSGAALGLLIPVVNGLASGNWFWLSMLSGKSDFVIVDILWLLLSLISIYVLYRLRRPVTFGKKEKIVTEVLAD